VYSIGKKKYTSETTNEKSPYILNASPGSPGICFIVLTSLKVPGKLDRQL
jgi:hypothetical protein